MSPNRADRQAKFRKLGEVISRFKKLTGDPDAHDYHTGAPVGFEMKRLDSKNRDENDPLNRDGCERTEIPLGPRFATPQWQRASYQ